MREETPYNPLDKGHLGESVADAILQRPLEPLPPKDTFIGAGVYAIYYTGDYPAYGEVAKKNRNNLYEWPIYVGKAIPSGARKGTTSLTYNPGTVLHRRLAEHSQSIEQASNLKLSDFCCRFLVVDDIWIPLGESLLIQRFEPVWNMIVDGFGNHDPGGGRYKQQRSSWDMLHPGRGWALKCRKNKKSEIEILSSLDKWFRKLS